MILIFKLGTSIKIGLGSYGDINEFDEHELVINLIDDDDTTEFMFLEIKFFS